MADDRALIELRFQLDQALKDIERLESAFKDSTRDMDSAADKVDFDKLQSELGQVRDGLDKTETKFLSVTKVAAGLATVLSLRALVSGITASIQAAREQEKAFQQVEEAVRSTGGAAGFTAEELARMASALQDVTTFGDEVILTAQSQLLTFTQLGREVFPQALEAALNLATRMDTDLRSAVVQLGKALNDPVTGLTALREAGIQFSEEQQETIEALASTNQLAEAQGLILEELETQFGGAARAAREGIGELEGLANALSDLEEAFGLGAAQGFIPSLQGGTEEIKRFNQAAHDLGQSVGAAGGFIVKALGFITDAARQAAASVEFLFNLFSDSTASAEQLAGDLDDLTEGMRGQAEAADEAAESTEEHNKRLLEEAKAAGEAAKAERDAAEASEEATDAKEELKTAVEEYEEAARKQIEAMKSEVEVLEEMREAAGLTAEGLRKVEEGADDQSEAVDRATESAESQAEAIRAQIERLEELQNAGRLTAREFAELTRLQDQLGSAFEEAAKVDKPWWADDEESESVQLQTDALTEYLKVLQAVRKEHEDIPEAAKRAEAALVATFNAATEACKELHDCMAGVGQ